MKKLSKLISTIFMMSSVCAFATKGQAPAAVYSPLLCSNLSGEETLSDLKMFFSPKNEHFSFTVPGSVGVTKHYSFQKRKHELTILTQDPNRAKRNSLRVNCTQDALSCYNAIEMFLGSLRSKSFTVMNSARSDPATKTHVWDVSYCAMEFLLDFEGRLTMAINAPARNQTGVR